MVSRRIRLAGGIDLKREGGGVSAEVAAVIDLMRKHKHVFTDTTKVLEIF